MLPIISAAILIDLVSSSLNNELAYLDPGSGSFIIQLLLASMVGAAFVIRTYWGKIRAFFNQSPKEENSQDNA